MLKRAYILILILAVCGVAVARVISIVHSRADRIHDHGPRVWRFGSVETTWHSRPRLCSAEGGRLIDKAFDLRSNTAEGGCATLGSPQEGVRPFDMIPFLRLRRTPLPRRVAFCC